MTLQNLRESTGEGVDYFQVLVSVFQNELRSDKNAHLSEFYLILPALTTNHVESLIVAKDKLNKRGKDSTNASFTDDGFALGVAYLLRVLGQDTTFDSLRWFKSAATHFGSEQARLAEEAKRLTGDASSLGAKSSGLMQRIRSKTVSGPTPSGVSAEDEAHAADLKRSRLKLHADEFLLLKYSLVGARTFFRVT